jgi:hypothetical protein
MQTRLLILNLAGPTREPLPPGRCGFLITPERDDRVDPCRAECGIETGQKTYKDTKPQREKNQPHGKCKWIEYRHLSTLHKYFENDGYDSRSYPPNDDSNRGTKRADYT